MESACSKESIFSKEAVEGYTICYKVIINYKDMAICYKDMAICYKDMIMTMII